MTSRAAGLGGLVFAGVLILAFALDGAIALTTGGPPVLAATTIGADLVRSGDSTVWRIELWAYIFAALPFAIFLPGLRAALAQRDQLLAEIGVLTAALFIALHTFHNIAYAAVVTGLAPSYAAGAPQAIAIEQVARGFIAFAEATFLPGGGIGGAFLVAALVSFGVAQRGIGARATGTAALVAASLTALGYLGVVVGQAALVISLAGWVVFIAWSAASGIALVREPIAVSAPSAPGSSHAARSSGAVGA